MCVYIYIYTYMYTHTYVYTHTLYYRLWNNNITQCNLI